MIENPELFKSSGLHFNEGWLKIFDYLNNQDYIAIKEDWNYKDNILNMIMWSLNRFNAYWELRAPELERCV